MADVVEDVARNVDHLVIFASADRRHLTPDVETLIKPKPIAHR